MPISTFSELAEVLDGRRTTLTIGTFDGVHLGHQALIHKVIKIAAERENVAVAVTFSNHPLSILAPPYNPQWLVTPARKAQLLAQLGVDLVLMVPFTHEFAAVPCEEFIQEFLMNNASVTTLVCGYDFTFGCRGAGTVDLLKSEGEKAGFGVVSVGPVTFDQHAVKSTHIRDLLTQGKVAQAACLLTRPHEVTGTIISGMQRGRKIGFPTANLQLPDGLQKPGGGVYVCAARIGNDSILLPAMVNIGTNPTFGGTHLSIEAHLLNFDGDIKGQSLSLFFLQRLRDEQKFSGIDALVQQLHHDRAQLEELYKFPAVQDLVRQIPPVLPEVIV